VTDTEEKVARLPLGHKLTQLLAPPGLGPIEEQETGVHNRVLSAHFRAFSHFIVPGSSFIVSRTSSLLHGALRICALRRAQNAKNSPFFLF